MSADLHQRIDELLRENGSDIGASECHGMLCGVLCGPQRFERDTWLAHVTGGDDAPAWSSPDARGLIDELVAWTENELRAEDFAFHLLLPADAESLTRRSEAFSAWCRGFLSGFGLTGIADLRVLGEDAREFIGDLKHFSTLAPAQGGEEDERALNELTEFTRMGVLVVRADVAANGTPPPRRVH